MVKLRQQWMIQQKVMVRNKMPRLMNRTKMLLKGMKMLRGRAKRKKLKRNLRKTSLSPVVYHGVHIRTYSLKVRGIGMVPSSLRPSLKVRY